MHICEVLGLKNYNRLLNVYIFLICPGSFGNGEICRKKSLKKQMWQLSQLQIIDQLYLEKEKEKEKREKIKRTISLFASG